MVAFSYSQVSADTFIYQIGAPTGPWNAGGGDAVTDAHLHEAYPGSNGNPVQTLVNDGAYHTITDAALLMKLNAGKLYLNVHSNTYPTGRFRVQVVPTPDLVVLGTGGQTVPSVMTTASAKLVVMKVDASSFIYQLTVKDYPYVKVTKGHLHEGYPGAVGPLVQALEVNDAYHLMTDKALLAKIDAGVLYMNVHTIDHPTGMFRGQVVLTPGLIVMATGVQQIPIPVITKATGQLRVTILTESSFMYQLSVQGYDNTKITAAHLHQAYPGANGGVVQT
jgi:hypothetical protein